MPEVTKMVRITNHRPTLLHLPDELNTGHPEQIVGLSSGKTLKPGGNNVDVQYWGRVKKNSAVVGWLKQRWIEEGGDPSLPEGPPAPDNLAGYNEPAALAFIEAEDDGKILHRWAKSEERPAVKSSLQRRLEALGK